MDMEDVSSPRIITDFPAITQDSIVDFRIPTLTRCCPLLCLHTQTEICGHPASMSLRTDHTAPKSSKQTTTFKTEFKCVKLQTAAEEVCLFQRMISNIYFYKKMQPMSGREAYSCPDTTHNATRYKKNSLGCVGLLNPHLLQIRGRKDTYHYLKKKVHTMKLDVEQA